MPVSCAISVTPTPARYARGIRPAIRLVAALGAHRSSARATWTKDDWDVFRANGWKTACKRAGLTPIPRPYDLRHSFASLLLAEGRTVHYVAAQLGHSPALTLSTYGHLIAEYADAGPIDAEAEIANARVGDDATPPATLAGVLWGRTVYFMTTKERLHQVVDAMSEQEAADALDYLASHGRDPLARRLDATPLDDEPLTDEERESLRDAREDAKAGRLVSMDDLRRELG
jgi:hypothetical protein